jgi:hypothetical protein
MIRGLVAGALGLALFGVQSLPPEHEHAAAAGHSAVVHRHVEPHHHHGPATGWAFDDDDDDAAVWIDNSYVVTVQPTVVVDLLVDWRHPSVVLSSPSLASGFFEFLARRVHDPPRSPKSLRAPPINLSA